MKIHLYSNQQKILHWISAAVILWALISGFYVALFDVAIAVREWVAFMNVSMTTLFIPVFAWRLYLALATRTSDALKTYTFAEYLALFAHRLIYLTVIVVLVTGVLMMDRAITVFDLFFIPQPLEDHRLIGLFLTVHIWSCAVLAVLIVMHVAAVIKHELAGRRILGRMSLAVSG